MKILLTGGGSGGHFTPIIAVAQAIREIAREERLLEPDIYFAAPFLRERKEVLDLNIHFVKIASGKARRYFSILNFFDLFKTGWGIIKAVWRVLFIFPDVIFGKGGYGSFPVLFAARVLGIPVILHESDTYPGRTNKWAGKFAKKVAIAFPEVATHFPKDTDIALTGIPVRKELFTTASKGAREYLNLEFGTPVVLVLGGSLGAQMINENIIDALPELVKRYQVIHQTGANNLDEVQKTSRLILEKSEFKHRYKTFGYLNTLALRMAAGAANIIVSRAGATVIFEIAQWGLPSIIIPITDTNGDHQRKNAFAYARSGAAEVIEEPNFTPHLLTAEIERILGDKELYARMQKSAKAFATPDAARKIAREIIDIALEHEK